MTTSTSTSIAIEKAANGYGKRVARQLDTGLDDLPYDITERLRASRTQALAKRKVTVTVRKTSPAAAVVRSGNALALGGPGAGQGSSPWWNALVSAVPLIALVVGLVMINISQDEKGVSEIAEVDAALLTDDLPPQAYADPGFVQFLKTSAANR